MVFQKFCFESYTNCSINYLQRCKNVQLGQHLIADNFNDNKIKVFILLYR